MRPIVRAGKLSYHTMGLAESRGEPKGHRNDNYRRFAKQHSTRITRRALKAGRPPHTITPPLRSYSDR